MCMVHAYTYIVHVCTCTRTCVWYMYMYMHVGVHVYGICTCICVWYMPVCTHTCICIRVQTYTYTYVYVTQQNCVHGILVHEPEIRPVRSLYVGLRFGFESKPFTVTFSRTGNRTSSFTVRLFTFWFYGLGLRLNCLR